MLFSKSALTPNPRVGREWPASDQILSEDSELRDTDTYCSKFSSDGHRSCKIIHPGREPDYLDSCCHSYRGFQSDLLQWV